MKRTKKNILAVVLAIVMVVTCLPITALANNSPAEQPAEAVQTTEGTQPVGEGPSAEEPAAEEIIPQEVTYLVSFYHDGALLSQETVLENATMAPATLEVAKAAMAGRINAETQELSGWTLNGAPCAAEVLLATPVTGEMVVNAIVTDLPVVEEPQAEEPPAEEPTKEEPAAEEPVVEEPAKEPAADEPTDEPTKEEPATKTTPKARKQTETAVVPVAPVEDEEAGMAGDSGDVAPQYTVEYDLLDGKYVSANSIRAFDTGLYLDGGKTSVRVADAVSNTDSKALLSHWRGPDGENYQFGDPYVVKAGDANENNKIVFTAVYERTTEKHCSTYTLYDETGKIKATFEYWTDKSNEYFTLPANTFIEYGVEVETWVAKTGQTNHIDPNNKSRDFTPGEKFTQNGGNATFSAKVGETAKTVEWTVKFVADANGTLEGKTEYTNIPNKTTWENAITEKIPTPVGKPGYEFDYWSVDINYLKQDPGDNAQIPTTGIISNVTYTAHFKAKTKFTLTFEAGANGTLDGTVTFTADWSCQEKCRG